MGESVSNERAVRGWVCPGCGYSLTGLKRGEEARGVACPECGRETSGAEQEAMQRAREMPRNLQRIAQIGFVFTLLMAGWSVIGIILRLYGSPRVFEAGSLSAFVGSLVLCGAALWPCVLIFRRLREIHRRS